MGVAEEGLHHLTGRAEREVSVRHQEAQERPARAGRLVLALRPHHNHPEAEVEVGRADHPGVDRQEVGRETHGVPTCRLAKLTRREL